MNCLFWTLLPLGAPTGQTPKTVDVIVRAKVGQQFRYKLRTSVVLGKNDSLSFTGSFTETLSKVENGRFYWDTTFHVNAATAQGSMKGQEESFKQMEGMQMTSVQNERGELLGTIVGGRTHPPRGNSNVVLPGRHAKVGDKWKAEILTSNLSVPIVYRLAELQGFMNHRVARIEGMYPPGSVARAIVPTQFFVDLKTGKVVRGTAQTVLNNQGTSVTLTYDLTLLEP